MSLFTPKQPRVRFSRGRAAGKPRSNFFVLSIGAAVVIVAAVMFYVGFEAPNTIPGRSYYTVYAYMHDADNLGDHYQVRIGGELAGQVLGTKVVNGDARVELQLSASFKPLLSDSTAAIRLRSAVGVRYLDITPGKSGSPIPNDGTLAASQTTTPVNLDQALDIFSKPVRDATDNFVGEMGQGFAGQGENVNETIQQTPGLLVKLGSLSKAVNDNINSLHNFVSGGNETASAVAPVAAYAANGFATDNKASQPFIVKRAELDATLSAAPSTLSTATQQLPSIRALVTQVDGLAVAAKPTLALAPTALRNTTSLLVTARPRLKDANATLNLLNKAVNPTLQFLQTAQPVLPQIDEAISDLLPTVDEVAPRSCAINSAMNGWSSGMKYGTAYSNYIQFFVDDSDPLSGSSTLHPLTSAYPSITCTADGSDEAGTPIPDPEQQVAEDK